MCTCVRVYVWVAASYIHEPLSTSFLGQQQPLQVSGENLWLLHHHEMPHVVHLNHGDPRGPRSVGGLARVRHVLCM